VICKDQGQRLKSGSYEASFFAAALPENPAETDRWREGGKSSRFGIAAPI